MKYALLHFLELGSKKVEQLAKEFMSKIDIDASGYINFTGITASIVEFIVSASNLREILTV